MVPSPHLSSRFSPVHLDHLVRTTIETVDFALGRPTLHPLAPSSPVPRPLLQLTLDVVHRSRIEISVILVALVYLERVRPQFKIADERWACERILIGALVLAAKVTFIHAFHAYNVSILTRVSTSQYVSDYTIKNARWARWSGTFSKEDIGRMERELLDILDWNLSVAEGDIMAHHERLSSLVSPPSLPLPSLKRPRPLFQADSGLELSPFCPPPRHHITVLSNKTRLPATSVTLPGFSSFLHNPYKHPLASSPSSLQSSMPSVLPVTSDEGRECKRLRLVTDPFNPRQPLSLTNKYRRLVGGPLQHSADAQVFKSLGLPRPWPKPFDPFVHPYIPPVSFYES